jgi:transposase, IS30 family
MIKKENLTQNELVQIYKMRKLGFGFREIARQLNRAHSTISREVKNNLSLTNHFSESYEKAVVSLGIRKSRRQSAITSRIPLKSLEIQNYTQLHLSHCFWSPETISGKLKTLGFNISYEAIYQWIENHKPELKKYLLISGKFKRRRISGRKHRKFTKPATPKVSIEQLPQDAKQRTTIGNFELDAIIGKKGKSALQVIVDRKTRRIFINKADSLKSKYYSKLLVDRINKDIPTGTVKTILNDNGVEHACHSYVDKQLSCQTYFCHPYCASERGTVENRNKMIRNFFSKGTDFDYVPKQLVQQVENLINHRPMKILDYDTPMQAWNKNIAA